jgi:hypothetical protein
MTDRGNPDRLLFIGHLVKDSVGTDSQGPETAQPPPQRVAGERIALEQAEGVLDRVDQGPVQIEEVAACSPGEDEPRQRSVGGRPGGGQLFAQLRQRDRLPTLDLAEPLLEGGDRGGVGEDLGGLLQGLVLVDRHERCRRNAIAGDQNVVPTIAHLIEEPAQICA